MNRRILIVLGSLGLLFLLFVTPISQAWQQEGSSTQPISPGPGEITLTIYQDQNLALIEDQRALQLNRGLSGYQIEGIPLGMLPESVQLEAPDSPEALQLVEQRLRGEPVSLDQLLKDHLGQEIEVFASGGDGTMLIYRGRLVSTAGGIILQDEAGRLHVIQDALRFRFPPRELFKPALLWMLQSELDGPHPVRLRYLSAGLNWQAHYTAVLDVARSRLELNSWVILSNRSGLSFEKAQLNLVAGQLQRARGLRKDLAPAEMAQPAVHTFEEQPFFEYHLYRLGRPASLADGETVQQAFLPPASLASEVKYIYEAYVTQGVQVWVEFDNDKAIGRPLPAGIVSLYQQTAEGLQFIGEARLAHTPVGERVKLPTGLAFDLVARRVQISSERLGDRRWRDSFQITLTNRKAEDVVILVREHLRGDWKIVSSKPEFTKLDAQTVEFRVPVGAGQMATVEYTVEYTTEF